MRKKTKNVMSILCRYLIFVDIDNISEMLYFSK